MNLEESINECQSFAVIIASVPGNEHGVVIMALSIMLYAALDLFLILILMQIFI